MKKRGLFFILLVAVIILLASISLVSAKTYSGFNRFGDNTKLFFSVGENKVKLALEIREKEFNSAIENFQNEEEKSAIKDIERARKKLLIVQEKVSVNTAEEVKASVNNIINKANEYEELSEDFEIYILEEEKTHLTAVLTEKTYEYCSELAKEDFALMLKDEECNPETAPEPLKKDLEKLKDLQERMFVKLMLEIRSCMDDPGTCNCENNVDEEQKIKCEKMVAFALKCEYQDDEGACNELNSLEAPKAESFVPEFLMNLFRAKEEQRLWGEKPSDCVPEECWNENDKPECRQYDKFKETEKDWDEYGNFIGTRNKCGKEGSTPTMRESIPQCFEGDVFLEEKCGKITMVENEEGLINYIIGKEVENVINEFENKSQNTIDKGNWTVDENGLKVSNKAREIKQEMNEIKNQIVERTFAPGTYDTEDSTNDVKDVVIEEGEGSGNESLEPEVKTDVAGGSGGNDVLPEPDLNAINPDLYDPDARAPGDTIGEPGEEEYAEGTTAEGTNNIEP